MKNSEEMVNSLLERRDRYIAEQKRRRTVLVRTITYLCCVCFIAVLSFGVYRVGFFNIQDPSPTISTGDDTPMTNPSNGDLIEVPNYVIIWGDNDDAAGSAFENLNGKKITISLANALRNSPENSKIAIIACPVIVDNTFVFRCPLYIIKKIKINEIVKYDRCSIYEKSTGTSIIYPVIRIYISEPKYKTKYKYLVNKKSQYFHIYDVNNNYDTFLKIINNKF